MVQSVVSLVYCLMSAGFFHQIKILIRGWLIFVYPFSQIWCLMCSSVSVEETAGVWRLHQRQVHHSQSWLQNPAEGDQVHHIQVSTLTLNMTNVKNPFHTRMLIRLQPTNGPVTVYDKSKFSALFRRNIYINLYVEYGFVTGIFLDK